jgi:hypothetical protein
MALDAKQSPTNPASTPLILSPLSMSGDNPLTATKSMMSEGKAKDQGD